MKLTQLSILKPVATIFVVLLFILLGVMGYINLGAGLFPSVNIPVIVVTSTYPGAGADEIEKDVIKPIEDAVSGISGLDRVSSSAQEGYAQVALVFKMSADTSSAFMDTQKAVDGIIDKLPEDASRPALLKVDPNASPIMDISLSGDRSFEELYGKAELLKERIERIEGVGSVTIYGGMKKELQINVDKAKTEYYGLSLSQVIAALQSDNVNFPGGVLYQPNQDKIINIKGEFQDVNQVKDVRIPVKSGYVRLSDVADVSLDYPKTTELSRLKDKTSIGLTIQKQSDANIVETGGKIKKEIDSLKASMKDIDLKIVQDGTVFIESSLNETKRNLIEGILTTALVLFIFLRQWNSVFIAMVAIPTSLVSTFFMMYLNKFTFNILSLMGLALCVGILVDDSVVVMENIHRHIKMGKDPRTAAIDGRSEIGMAAIAITLSDVVVFAPIAFMSGMVGQYFRQFGLVVVFATLFSLAVSFTLTPMMASRMFHEKGIKAGRFKAFSTYMDRLEEKLKEIYGKLLTYSLRHRLIVVLSIIILLVISVSFIATGKIGTEFMPYTDEGELNINLTLDPGSTLENTNKKVQMVENFVKTIPEVDYYRSQVGSSSEGENTQANKGSLYVKLVDKKKRHRSQKSIVEEVRNWAKKNMTGADVVVIEPSMSSGGTGDSGKPINISIKGAETEVINEISSQVEEIVRNTKGAIEVGNSTELGKPAYNVDIDKVAAARYGITSLNISNTIRSSIEGTKAGTFRQDGEEYDLEVKLKEGSIKDLNDLKTLYVSGTTGNTIRIGQLANIKLSDSPALIRRLNKQRVSTVSANIQEGYTLGAVSSEITKKLNDLKLPDGYSISAGGEEQQMNDTFNSLLKALVLSILLVYMILGILYESFLTPFVRILALPVGFIGALTMLAVTGKSLNMMSMIGLIMLDGLAAKNGTLLIDYTNTLMAKGLSLREALLEAGKTRIKPILMTSFAMIVGMTPTALALGNGAEFKSSMALVIIGGMISSTILSPILLPVAYTYLDDFQNLLKRVFLRKKKLEVSQELD